MTNRLKAGKGEKMNEIEYQTNELAIFLNSKNCFFDHVKDFSDNLETMDVLEQIEWIENGSYGAGACLAMQKTLKGITPRANAEARIGQTVLHALYGKPFPYWKKLSTKAQNNVSKAVKKWSARKHSFALTLEI